MADQSDHSPAPVGPSLLTDFLPMAAVVDFHYDYEGRCRSLPSCPVPAYDPPVFLFILLFHPELKSKWWNIGNVDFAYHHGEGYISQPNVNNYHASRSKNNYY